jgi:hypothetical protein
MNTADAQHTTGASLITLAAFLAFVLSVVRHST